MGGDVAKQFAKLAKTQEKQAKMIDKVLEVVKIVKSPSSAATSKSKDMWTCGNCGDDRCCASRTFCHKCNTPQGSLSGPPAVATAAKQLAPTAVAMKVQEPVEEANLETQISDLEGWVKFLKVERTPGPSSTSSRRR